MKNDVVLNEIRLQPERYFKNGQHISVKNRWVGNFPLHWHNYFEMEILSEGEAIHYLNGARYDMRVGSGYILTPSDYHIIIPNDPKQKIWHIPFDEELLSPQHLRIILSSGFPKNFHLDSETYQRVEMLLNLLKYEYTQDGETCTKELLECLLCTVFRTMTDVPQAMQSENISDMMKGLLYLETHFRENPSLADVASYAGFNPSYFSVLFKKTTGQTYTQRLNTLRISYAKNLLRGNMNISDICYASGFETLSNFHNAFKKSTGMSPTEYRKKCKLIP